MHSTELLIFSQSNLFPSHSHMKGSVVKNASNKIQLNHHHPQSATNFLDSNSQQFYASPKVSHRTNEDLQLFESETHRSEVKQKATKTISISLPNKKSSGPVIAQNYARKQPKTQEAMAYIAKNPPKDKINQTNKRYQAGNMFDFQCQSRMSLSSFQQNFKTLRLKKMISKTEEMIHLKLEGEAYGTSQILRKKHMNSKQKQNLYITQQSGHINFDKPSQSKCSATRVRSIISKLHQEEQKEKVKTDEENKTLISKNRSVSASYKRHDRKASGNLRQKLHINIINFVEQKPTQKVVLVKKSTFSQLYNRFAKSKNVKAESICGKQQRRIQIASKIFAMPDIKKLEINSRRSKTQEYKNQRQSSSKKQISHHQGQTESTTYKKLKQRKNLLKNYTFKKQQVNQTSKGNQEESSPQDFYVSGWNHSTQFERRQLIMLI